MSVRPEFALERWLDKDTNKLESFAWPPGYPIYYIDGFNSVLCPDCANEYIKEPDEDQRFNPQAGDINYEDEFCICEKCNVQIECAYPSEENNEDQE